jgi:hypothetical protein
MKMRCFMSHVIFPKTPFRVADLNEAAGAADAARALTER